MEDFRVKDIFSAPLETPGSARAARHGPDLDFKELLSQSVEGVNKKLAEADRSAQEMTLGKIDVHEAMIAIEQANLSLRMMIQIRNKLIAAYEELMRMQI